MDADCSVRARFVYRQNGPLAHVRAGNERCRRHTLPSARRILSGVNGMSVSGAAPNGRSASLMAFITQAGAPASVMNAINDALRPLGAKPLTDMPFTPDKVLRALGKV